MNFLYSIKQDKLEKYIFLCITIFIFGDFATSISTIKNTALYISLLLCIVYIFMFRKVALLNFKNNYNDNKILIWLLCIVVFVIFIFSIFPYDSSYNSFFSALNSIKKQLILFFVVMFCCIKEQKNSENLFFAIIFSFIFLSIYFIFDEKNNFDFALNNPIINRNFSFYFDNVSAFCVVGLFFIKKTKQRIILSLFLMFAICLDVLTGARGSWVAFFATSLFIFILMAIKGVINKKMLIQVLMLLLTLLSFVYVVYQNSPYMQYKIMQKSSSGRDIIIKNRLPLLLNSDRKFIGLGHGGYQYNKFINDKQKEFNLNPDSLGPNGGILKDGLIRYYHDEPTFLAAYYHYGVGSFFVVVLVFYIFYIGITLFLKHDNYFALSVSASVLSFYIVRGFFEWREIINLIMFSTLIIIFNHKGKKSENSSL
ncbi:hypothetical protein [Campylobacter mucosalis]|uniref:hypothetical protein n=1 Tax=Campylobacter mucosalis TaxID=202 RepID=UPI00147055D4|nr:hypothetical protein [Campylobacter mucosalis]